MLFKMCHHAGLNELRRFSDGTSELFESRVDLIACLNAQLLKGSYTRSAETAGTAAVDF